MITSLSLTDFTPSTGFPNMPLMCDDDDGTNDELTLSLLLDHQPQVLAPALNDDIQYHVFFLYHANDRDWIFSVIEKLESSTLGFRCCCHERDLSSSLSQPQGVLYGMKNSLKTVCLLTPDFVTSTWTTCEGLIGEIDAVSLPKDIIAVLLQDCEIPAMLSDLPLIEVYGHGWWTKLLARLALPDEIAISEEAMMNMTSSLVGLQPGLQTSYLLLSIKSRCGCCGKEFVDPLDVPDELICHGVQIPEEEYAEVIRQLMCDLKFRCHIWCYNMPLAIALFTVFLGLCLIVIPILETHYVYNGTETGLEFVHGGVVWLCVLTVYIVVTHLARRKMKDRMYKSLSKVNTVFVKYNILLGIENLGLADCNKYYLHFFYYELGPCLAYLQEMFINSEDCNQCYTNHINNHTTTDDHIEVEVECDDHIPSISDRMTVLENANITNASMQHHAEDLLLDHSGEYINMLITKKLDRPRKQRHARGTYCLCQFVEQRVYKMLV